MDKLMIGTAARVGESVEDFGSCKRQNRARLNMAVKIECRGRDVLAQTPLQTISCVEMGVPFV